MDTAKRKTLKKSSLEKIKGIGPSKAKALLSHFKTISALKEATKEELEVIVSSRDAENIIEYFVNN
jgi:excinuclease ABC subunit C